jgi:pimeloyl-ACP methyl ester carboxylesterase
VAPDLFGFGDSEELEVCAAEEDYLQLLRFLLTSLQVEHCVIVGHSMGGQIAARLASELGIRIAGVILVEAPVSNELQDIKCPILLVFGQENEERTAIATAQRKQNSLAKVLFINHASHNVMLDQPSVFYRELRQWLAAHSSPFDDNARH